MSDRLEIIKDLLEITVLLLTGFRTLKKMIKSKSNNKRH